MSLLMMKTIATSYAKSIDRKLTFGRVSPCGAGQNRSNEDDPALETARLWTTRIPLWRQRG